MSLNEVRRPAWTGEARGAALGRLTCAALPQATNSEHATTFFGCAEMGTYTGMADELLLAVVLEQTFREARVLCRTLIANAALQEFYTLTRSSSRER